jgi:hypothetical protein
MGFLVGCSPSDDGEFTRTVLPIAEAKCVKCHLDGKKRGGLSLDSHKDVFKGGKSGNVIVPGDAASSLLYQSLTGELEDLKMPKKGEPLTPEEIEAIRAWIDSGAH